MTCFCFSIYFCNNLVKITLLTLGTSVLVQSIRFCLCDSDSRVVITPFTFTADAKVSKDLLHQWRCVRLYQMYQLKEEALFGTTVQSTLLALIA